MNGENGSSTKILMELMNRVQAKVEAQDAKINALENKISLIERERDDYLRRNVADHGETVWTWYQQLREEGWTRYWHDMRRLVDAFERDNLFDVIYSARNQQRYLQIMAAALAAAIGSYVWTLIGK